jgi:hypothetical protein
MVLSLGLLLAVLLAASIPTWFLGPLWLEQSLGAGAGVATVAFVAALAIYLWQVRQPELAPIA